MQSYLPLSDQLNLLFEVRLHPDERPFTLQEVSEQTGVSVGTISQMRGGKIQNPQLSTLRALCQFFHVPLRYFDTRTLDECYAILGGTDDAASSGTGEIAFRASGLSPKSQRDILTIIKWVQAAEQQRQNGDEMPPLPGLEDYDEQSSNE